MGDAPMQSGAGIVAPEQSARSLKLMARSVSSSLHTPADNPSGTLNPCHDSAGFPAASVAAQPELDTHARLCEGGSTSPPEKETRTVVDRHRGLDVWMCGIMFCEIMRLQRIRGKHCRMVAQDVYARTPGTGDQLMSKLLPPEHAWWELDPPLYEYRHPAPDICKADREWCVSSGRSCPSDPVRVCRC